ncbi:MAG: trypsin-like peptidase domain-containing protein [Bacteroidaceae bacterium]|nr:trypsin-like peptidase domain-containing protein [Bacteroidaceae bacterium]
MTQNTKKWLGAAALVLSSSVLTGAVMRAGSRSAANDYSDNGFFGAQPASLQMPNGAAATAAAAPSGLVDLTTAADRSVNSVVYIKVTQNAVRQRVRVRDPFEDFFGEFFGYGNGGQSREQEVETQPRRQGAGSGVIITADGYIVTNNHVVAGADEILVKLNDNTEYKGRIIGLDETTDLALIKVEATGLPAITIGNSDDLRVGEWVLAVGNPFNLTSTVTAGIVSAKARSLGANGVESFIQTDAAINAGNSGGALVNERGELVGINAMLYSQTGSYSGYGFAIPTSIMNKVVKDLKEFGIVQRALLGVSGTDVTNYIDSEKAKGNEVDLGTTKGIYIHSVEDNSTAADLGLQKGDVITAINGKEVIKMAELQEALSQHRPGDQVRITFIRGKKSQTKSATLRNAQGGTDVIEEVDIDLFGAQLKPLSDELKRQLALSYGLEVVALKNGKMKDANITKGMILLKVNDKELRTVEDFEEAVRAANQSSDRTLWIRAVTQSGRRVATAITLGEEDGGKKN